MDTGSAAHEQQAHENIGDSRERAAHIKRTTAAVTLEALWAVTT